MSLFDFTAPPPQPDGGRAEATRRIKQWVQPLNVLGEDGMVHVAELQCHEPGCPDCETVITLMFSTPGKDRTVKILKPLAEVTEGEVINFILHSFATGPPAGMESVILSRTGRHC